MVPDENDRDPMQGSVELRQRRETRWRVEGERPLWRNLSMIGALGWLIVVPTLIGALAGRWLDGQSSGGIFWTVSLIFAGAVLGFAMAWRRMKREEQ
jgi:ATP synthase protein I